MTEIKTQPTNVNIHDYIDGIEDEQMREESLALIKIMEEITATAGVMWGGSILGFGNYRLKYPSGRELDWMLVGFAPRKANLVVYLMDGFKKYDNLLAKLGKHKTGKSCLYLKRLSDVNMDVLKEMITASVNYIKSKNDS